MSGGTPGPLSRTQNSSGRLTGVGADRAIFSRTPGPKAVESSISPSIAVGADRLGGVLHEVEEHLDELVAVAEHVRQRGIVVLGEADVAREAGLRDRFTWSSTAWMLTLSRSIGRTSEKASIRSTSLTMRSVSSQISRVSARSSSPTAALEQLRGAADAGQRVLDLVRQHRRRAQKPSGLRRDG